jgi:hypothetical protein
MRQWVLVAVIVFGCTVAAEAAPVNELETAGNASNNSAATAQSIPTSAFTLPVPPTVFNPPGFPTASLFGRAGGPDVDIYRISGSGRVILDVDNEVISSDFDTVLFLFNSSGASLVIDDDAPLDPGSEHTHDARIDFILPAPGIYFVGVTGFFNTNCEQAGPACSITTSFISNGPQPADDAAGEYLLHVSLEQPLGVPVPATLALLLCSGALAAGVRLWAGRS